MDVSDEERILSDLVDLRVKEKDLTRQYQDSVFKETNFKNVKSIQLRDYLDGCYGNQIINPRETTIRIKRQLGLPILPKLNPELDNTIADDSALVTCLFMNSCNVSLSTPITPHCYCDTLCHLYKDCCLDAKQNTVKKNGFVQDRNQLKQYMTCRAFWDKIGVQMIDRCPDIIKKAVFVKGVLAH